MPYSGPDDKDLPDNIKKLSEGKRAQWVRIWNSAYRRCMGDDGNAAGCEAPAFRQANGVVLKADELRFAVNRVTSVQREEVNGKQYLVAPCIAIKAGVLNGELVPADEIATHFRAWNGRPFVVGHPKDAEGADVSANDPERLAKYQIGRFFSSWFADGKLKGEIWVDLARAPLVDGGAAVVQRLESGEPLEVSTAYFRDREERKGESGGEEYEAVARNLRPDHLAALLDTEGACSWHDGCGAPRVNEEDDVQANILGKARRPKYSGTTDAPWKSPTLGAYLSAYPGDKPDTNRVADLPGAVKSWIAGHTLLGDPGADNERDLIFFPVVTPQGKLSAGAVRAVLSGRGARAKIPQAAKESAQAVARRLLDKEFKVGEQQSSNENVVLNALRAIFGAFGLQSSEESEEVQMNKADMVARIAKRLALNEEDGLGGLDSLSSKVLGALVKALGKPPKANEEEEPQAEQESTPQTTTSAGEVTVNVQEPEPCAESDKELSKETYEALAARVQALEKRLENRDGERKAELVKALAGNAAVALTEEQLERMDAETLEALRQSFAPADYSGQGGGPVSANRDDVTLLVMPPIFVQEE